MKYRILSTILLWLIFALALFIGKITAIIYLLISLSLLSQYELHKIFKNRNLRPISIIGIVSGVFIILGSYYYNIFFITSSDLLVITIIFVIIVHLPLLFCANTVSVSLLPTLFSVIYIPFMLNFYTKTFQLFSNQKDGNTIGCFFIIWLIIISKFSDVGGLIIGSKIGKNKLARNISPSKTWEGVWGGIIFATLFGIFLQAIFISYYSVNLTILKALIISISIAVISIISDLIESAIKRFAKVKDSSSLVPGIGGFFDITDSLILSAPLGYFLIKILYL